MLLLPVVALVIGWKVSPPNRAVSLALKTTAVVLVLGALVLTAFKLPALGLYWIGVGILTTPFSAFAAWAVSSARARQLA